MTTTNTTGKDRAAAMSSRYQVGPPKEGESQIVLVLKESKAAFHIIVVLGVALLCLMVILAALVFKQQRLKKLSQHQQQSPRPPAGNPVYGLYYNDDGPEPLPQEATITDNNDLYSNSSVEESSRAGDNGASGNIYSSLMHPTPDHQ